MVMKLTLIAGVVVVAGAVLAVTYGQAEALFWSSATARHYLGYIEGETTLVAPPVAGRLVVRKLERGDRVDKGTQLYVIDTTQAEAEVARAAATLAEYQARHDNLLTGKRAEEQDVVRAQRQEIEANLRAASAELARQQDLVAKNFVSREAYEQSIARVAELKARAASMTAKEHAGDLSARQPEIAAAAAQIQQSQARLAQVKNQLADLAPAAPEDALVENTFFNIGEWVPAGQPVVSLLPDFRVKLRFFVPESHMPQVRPGVRISFTCDGCPPENNATISYISPRAEYTPPVIYSQGARAKLVFMVEARPDPTHRLQPGLPISVNLLKANNNAQAAR
jgi:HlyD family secretion protein